MTVPNALIQHDSSTSSHEKLTPTPTPTTGYSREKDISYEVASISRKSVTDFLRRTRISPQTRRWVNDPTGLVERKVMQELKQWDAIDFTAPKFKKAINTSVCVATVVYGHTHIDTQAQIALYSLFAGCVDDHVIDNKALEEFTQRLTLGYAQLHPLLDLLVHYLRRMPEFYPSYSSSAIFAATIQFVNATLFDRRCGSEISMPLQPDAIQFVRHKRAINGLGDVFNLFAWDKLNFPDVTEHIQILPDARIYLDYSNDILSFYKEELAGEENNFIHDRMAVTQKDLANVLSDTLDDLVASVQRARLTLQSEIARDVWEQFIEGWVTYHFLCPRYRLSELFGTEFLTQDGCRL